MWAFLGSLLSGIASWITGRAAVGTRNNTPEMVNNATAKDDSAAADKVEVTVNKAAGGDQKALEDLRRELGE